MKTVLYNQRGKEVEEIPLAEEVFGLPLNRDLLHQVVVSYQANKRRATAHTKTRDEVSGGGRKPWPQKGTGRARHGSIRSPLWVGGGTTFGPRRNKKYEKKIPKKMKVKALRVALSDKLRRGNLIFVDEINLEKGKTKLMARMLERLKQKLGKEEGSVLIVLGERDQAVLRATSNLAQARVKSASEINALHLLEDKYLLMTSKAVERIKDRLKNR